MITIVHRNIHIDNFSAIKYPYKLLKRENGIKIKIKIEAKYIKNYFVIKPIHYIYILNNNYIYVLYIIPIDGNIFK